MMLMMLREVELEGAQTDNYKVGVLVFIDGSSENEPLPHVFVCCE